jgi:hypothetical protein
MNYTKSHNTYFATPKDDPHNRIELEVGDSKQPDFFPQIKIMRWDNEVNFSIRLVHEEIVPKVSKVGDKIHWQGKTIEACLYDFAEGEGSYEFEIILKEKPVNNKIEFTLNTKGLDFFYQPPLTEEVKVGDWDGRIVSVTEMDAFDIDGNSLNHRPENVCGAYAVYASENKINYVGGKEYKCGQVGMIYRPKIIDLTGTGIWGILNIDKNAGILNIEISQDFLDRAIYPITIDPTIGYTSAGDSVAAWNGYFMAAAKSTTDASGGVVSKIQCAAFDVMGNSYVKMAIYDATPTNLIANSYPGAILVTRTSTSKPTQDSEWTSSTNVSATLAALTAYWLAFATQDSTVYIFYNSAPNGSCKYASIDYTLFPPNTAPSSTNYTAILSVYATYTPAAGGLSIPVVMNQYRQRVT